MTKAKKNTEKTLTLRQQLRADANVRLDAISRLVGTAVDRALEEAGVELPYRDVMRFCLGGQTQTVHEKLVTQLANQAEAELLAIWNKQADLPLGEQDAIPSD